jgi:hypothetical protein
MGCQCHHAVQAVIVPGQGDMYAGRTWLGQGLTAMGALGRAGPATSLRKLWSFFWKIVVIFLKIVVMENCGHSFGKLWAFFLDNYRHSFTKL